MTTEKVLHQKNLVTVIMLAWLLPGAGHFYIGKKWKGAVFFFSLTVLFIAGLWMHGVIFVPGGEDLQSFLISILGTIGDLGLVVYYILSLLMYHSEGEISYRFYETGMLYTLVAGVLNYLIIVDAIDICKGRKE